MLDSTRGENGWVHPFGFLRRQSLGCVNSFSHSHRRRRCAKLQGEVWGLRGPETLDGGHREPAHQGLVRPSSPGTQLRGISMASPLFAEWHGGMSCQESTGRDNCNRWHSQRWKCRTYVPSNGINQSRRIGFSRSLQSQVA